ncbi:MAG: sel1 repeat family protein [Proteobacteria bacterium]|nr:sel1 repeat family protein [Pseudomonadota bacterium]
MNKISPILLLISLLIALPVKADFNDGVVAYLMGDYDKAFTTMQSLAETSDHGYAQYYIGMMYMKGQGVEQDYKKAGKWFRKASEKNIAQAQYKLGNLYYKGRGVPKDYEFAYVWFSVGASHEHDLSKKAVNKAKKKLSDEELSEADKTIATYVKKYGPKEDVDPSKPIRIENE